MSTHDSSQPGTPRRKLVLRKIPTLPPLPAVKPPPRPSVPVLSTQAACSNAEPLDVTELAQVDDDGAAVDELETPTSAATVVIPRPSSAPSLLAAPIARTESVRPPPMPASVDPTPAFESAIPRSPSSLFFPPAFAETRHAALPEPADLYGAILKPMPTVVLVDSGAAMPGVPFVPAAVVAPPSEATPPPPVGQSGSRVSILPFVASVSVPPPAAVETRATLRERIGRVPAVVSRGGWLAAAVLVVVLGALAGEQAAVRIRAAAAAPGAPVPVTAAAAVAPTAAPQPTAVAAPAPLDVDSVIPEMAPIPTIVLRSDPPRRVNHAWTVPAKAPAVVGASDGWTVAAPSTAVSSATTKAKTTPSDAAKTWGPAHAEVESPGTESTLATAIAVAPPRVDPLVQAIRDDIREDESRPR